MKARGRLCVSGLMFAMSCVSSARPKPRAPVASLNAATVLGNVERHYANASQLRAQFREVTASGSFQDAVQTRQGIVLVLKPAKVRFDYLVRTERRNAAAVTETVIFDGSTLWNIDHRTRVVVQNHNPTGSMLTAVVSFATSSSNLRTQFDVSLNTSGIYGTGDATVLELRPKQQAPTYNRLFFVVDTADWHVGEAIVVGANGDTVEFKFYAPDVKRAVKEPWFQVAPGSLPTYQRTVVSTPTPGTTNAETASAGSPGP